MLLYFTKAYGASKIALPLQYFVQLDNCTGLECALYSGACFLGIKIEEKLFQ